MKQFATWFTHGVSGGAKLRKAIYSAKTGTEVLDRVNAFFAEPPAAQDGEAAPGMFPETELVCD
jgi:tRNA-dihydrouridine synthase B